MIKMSDSEGKFWYSGFCVMCMRICVCEMSRVTTTVVDSMTVTYSGYVLFNCRNTHLKTHVHRVTKLMTCLNAKYDQCVNDGFGFEPFEFWFYRVSRHQRCMTVRCSQLVWAIQSNGGKYFGWYFNEIFPEDSDFNSSKYEDWICIRRLHKFMPVLRNKMFRNSGMNLCNNQPMEIYRKCYII